MARRLSVLLCLLLAVSAIAEESYLGLFMQGQKIGYVASSSQDETVGGQALKRSDSRTVIGAGLLGQALNVVITSQSWTDAAGKPRLMKFEVLSGGRSQKTEANFDTSKIHLVIDNNGSIDRRSIDIPKDANVVDDAMNSLLADGAAAGAERVYYVLDPMTASLVRNTAKLVGPSKTTVQGKEFDATLIEISEPRATTKIYVSAKGDLVKAEAFAGIEMIPLSKEEALADTGSTRPVDLANVTRLSTNKPLGNIDELSSVTLRISDANLARVPSDAHQTVKGKGKVWTLDLHPAAPFAKPATSIAAAAKAQPAFLKPGLHIPSDTTEFKQLAKQVVGGAPSVIEGARRIHKYVNGNMRPNAGIGVLRNASEVLKSKEGVCRDYAILTATLLRAANIPARVASGLVYSGGSFYYHAWAEYWDGKRFIGLDTTRPSSKVTAGHIKLAHGSVEEAFLFTFLDKARVEVLNIKRGSK